MKVGLVLGAGGVVGAAWLMGALEALHAETGWNPAEADRIVGTSAGSVVGALLADGIEPAHLSAYAAGRALDGVQDADDRVEALAQRLGGREQLDDIASRLTGDQMRLHAGLPLPGPGSWSLILSTHRAPWRHTPSALLAGWLPRGFISTGPVSELVETFVAGDWPDHPGFWAVATDYASGDRVVFGRQDAPHATIGPAVAASCAIPGLYHPPRIAGRRYVDGGVCSLSNLDLLAGEGLDLVLALNPTSSIAEIMGGSPAERVGGVMRGLSGRRLGHEARKLRAEGTEVVFVEPSAEDVGRMGLNLMARGRRVEVMECARRTTALALREMRGGEVRLPGRGGRGRPARRRQAAAGRSGGRRASVA